MIKLSFISGVLFLALVLSGCSGSGSFFSFGKKKPVELVQVRGFRVQVMTTSEKGEADVQAASVIDWWEALSAEEKQASGVVELNVEVLWQQPYYRVRVGNFVDQQAAGQLMGVMEPAFPEVFIVPDQVWVPSTSR